MSVVQLGTLAALAWHEVVSIWQSRATFRGFLALAQDKSRLNLADGRDERERDVLQHILQYSML